MSILYVMHCTWMCALGVTGEMLNSPSHMLQTSLLCTCVEYRVTP